MWKTLVRGTLFVLGVLVPLAAGGLGWRALRQHRISEAMVIGSPNGIDERGYVRIGGVNQWITIRGWNRDNPAILILHGGPGAAYSALPSAFLPWEHDFTVVQWDQRGAGKSYSSDKAAPSIELMVRDAVEVSEYARRRLRKHKIILLGHSWGSVLGFLAVKARPDLFDAWVGTGQIVNMQQNEVVAYAQLLAKCRVRGDRDSVDALERSGPPPYHDIRQMGVERRVAMKYEPGAGLQTLLAGDLTAPDYSLKDAGNYVRGFIDGDDFFRQTMDGPLARMDLQALGTDFSIPFFIVQGADDDITPASLARAYFDRITAPKKAFLLVPDAGHVALMTRPDAFVKFLRANLRPI
jgi:pimeloyl-ACP methyl ester carboxylesterase